MTDYTWILAKNAVMSFWESPGKSDEWYTPKHVFDALGCEFDLDVASPAAGGTYVPAKNYLTDRALEKEWTGFVWMNPPFGGRNGLAPWLDRFTGHDNGIALVPDRTSAPWFQDTWRKTDAVLFTRKLKFLRPDGTEGKSPSNGTALFACGATAKAALERACVVGLGILAIPTTSEREHV